MPPENTLRCAFVTAVVWLLPACASVALCHYGSVATVAAPLSKDAGVLVGVVDAALRPLGYSAGMKLPIPDRDLYGFSVGVGLHLVVSNRVDVSVDVAAGTILTADYQEYSRSEFVNRTEDAISRAVDATYGEHLRFQRSSSEHPMGCAFPMDP